MSFVLSANRLLDGHVIYLTDDGTWSEYIEHAKFLSSDEDQESALALGAVAEDACEIVAADLVPLSEDQPKTRFARIRPARLREVIRAEGPTVRPDLARQTF